jgi:hypothetical protein
VLYIRKLDVAISRLKSFFAQLAHYKRYEVGAG